MTDQTNAAAAAAATAEASASIDADAPTTYRVTTANEFYWSHYIVSADSPGEAEKKVTDFLDAQRTAPGPDDEPLTEWEEEQYKMHVDTFGPQDRRDFIYEVSSGSAQETDHIDSWGDLETPAHLDSGENG